MDGAAQPHEFIFIDEAGFDLSKTRRRGRNVIGQRAIVHVPGQRGGNITLCAAISLRGLLHHHAKLVSQTRSLWPFPNTTGGHRHRSINS